jgi:hypothetical protein
MRMTSWKKSRPRLLCMLLAATIIVAVSPRESRCGSPKMDSWRRSGPIAIDGVNTEWDGHTLYLDEVRVVLGAANDDENLYLSLMSADRGVMRQILMSGLTIWVDAGNGKKKSFGIKLPFSMNGGMWRHRGEFRPGEGAKPTDENAGGGTEQGQDRRSGRPPMDEAMIQQHFANRIDSLGSFDIIDPARGGTHEVLISDSSDVHVKTGFNKGAFIFELAIPLHRSETQPYALDVDPGATIAIGLDSPEVNMEEFMERRRGTGTEGEGQGGGERPGGGWGGRPPGGGGTPPGGGMQGGQMGGGMGGGPGGMRVQLEPIDTWVTVKLASH